MIKENPGYTPKRLHFDDEGRSGLISGITKMSQAVKSTLGPSGHTVLIESPNCDCPYGVFGQCGDRVYLRQTQQD